MKHRRYKVKQIWRDRLPAARPDCLSGLEWAILHAHVEEHLEIMDISKRLTIAPGDIREALRGASIALLIHYAFNGSPNTNTRNDN